MSYTEQWMLTELPAVDDQTGDIIRGAHYLKVFTQETRGINKEHWKGVYAKTISDLFTVLATISRLLQLNHKRYRGTSKEKDILYRLGGRTAQLLVLFLCWAVDDRSGLWDMFSELFPDWGKITGELHARLDDLHYVLPAHDPERFK